MFFVRSQHISFLLGSIFRLCTLAFVVMLYYKIMWRCEEYVPIVWCVFAQWRMLLSV